MSFVTLFCVLLIFSGDRKQDSGTTSVHSKHFIEMLQSRKLYFACMRTIWGDKYGCDY